MSTHPESPTTFSAFARRWRPMLLARARGVLGASDLAEDVAQTVLLKVWSGGGWGEIESPRAYFRRAAHREAVRALEEEGKSEPLSAVESSAQSTVPGPWEIVVHREHHATLETCLRRLPERCALVMTLKLIEGLTHPEIAKRLKIDRGAVDKQVARGKRCLQGWLEVGPEGDIVPVTSFRTRGGRPRYGPGKSATG